MNRRQSVRIPPSPHDKSTIVSLLHKGVVERKETIFPSTFHLEAGDPKSDKFKVLVVGSSSWWKETEEGMPDLEIPVSSFDVARSVVEDYAKGLVGCDMGEKMPGLFFVPGAFTETTVIGYTNPDPECKPNEKTFKDLYNRAKKRQENWFRELILLADIGWARTQGNPLSITDDARYAAEYFGLKNKPWMGDYKSYELSPCKACGELINIAFPICKFCKAVNDPEKAKLIEFAK